MTFRYRPPSNHWPAPTSYEQMARVTVPHVKPVVKLTCHPKAASLLTWIVWQVDQNVAPVNPSTTAAWNNRPIAGSNRWSTHATGAAVDINWDLWPMFKQNMSKQQRKACWRIQEITKGAVVWGGKRSWVLAGRADEMHWEIVVQPDTALRVGKRLWADSTRGMPIGGNGVTG